MSMKKGWKRYAAVVVCLVMLSMLVPLVFLLGLYGGIPSSNVGDDLPPKLKNETRITIEYRDEDSRFEQPRNFSSDDLMGKLLSRLANNSSAGNTNQTSLSSDKDLNSAHNFSETTHENLDKLSTRHPVPAGFSDHTVSSSLFRNSTEKKVHEQQQNNEKEISAVKRKSDELVKCCEFNLGSYCNWSTAHTVEMADAMVRLLKNRLFLLRAYYPSIVRHRNREKLQLELRKHIQDIERMLSEATADADLPASAKKKIKVMDGVLAKVKTYPIDCNNVAKKLTQILDLTEDEARFHRKQSVFLYQLAIHTMPKSLHCLSMRLTVEYFRTYHGNTEMPSIEKLEDLDLYHYVVFSTNILAASVVINSTVVHAKEPQSLVFHILTDKENHVAMKFWLYGNQYRNATVHVQRLDELNLRKLKTPLETLSSEEFRIAVEASDENTTGPATLVKKLKYLSTFNHPHFFLPKIFPKLNKVVLLDDDVVIQRDLTPLWSIDLQGKVNGAVKMCDVRFRHLKKYLNTSNYFANGFDGDECAWMTGLNIIDLQQWRLQELTQIYYKWAKLQNRYKIPWRFGALPASMITFYNMTHALEGSWIPRYGLGHDFAIEQGDIKKAAVLHYNGNLKPWLEIGIKQYKSYWSRYLKKGNQYMLECNVNG